MFYLVLETLRISFPTSSVILPRDPCMWQASGTWTRAPSWSATSASAPVPPPFFRFVDCLMCSIRQLTVLFVPLTVLFDCLICSIDCLNGTNKTVVDIRSKVDARDTGGIMERDLGERAAPPPSAVERIWHIEDSQGQISDSQGHI